MTPFIQGLQAIAATLTGAPEFTHESVQMFNVKLDAKDDAVMFAPALGLGKIVKAGTGFKVTQKIVVEFLQQTEFENDMTQNQSIINDMADLAIEFIQAMNASTVFDHPTEYETNYVYETFDANFAGIALTFDCTLRQPYSLC